MIKRLITEYAPLIGEAVDSEALLWAVYECEKYTKQYRVPRFEHAYAPGGLYFRNSTMVRREYAKWGSYAACSFSNFQIMFIVARELGYDAPPLALDKDSVALPYVVRYINTRVLKRGAATVEEIADAYNSGTHKDDIKPERYINKFTRKYAQHLARLKKERNAGS